MQNITNFMGLPLQDSVGFVGAEFEGGFDPFSHIVLPFVFLCYECQGLVAIHVAHSSFESVYTFLFTCSPC